MYLNCKFGPLTWRQFQECRDLEKFQIECQKYFNIWQTPEKFSILYSPFTNISIFANSTFPWQYNIYWNPTNIRGRRGGGSSKLSNHRRLKETYKVRKSKMHSYFHHAGTTCGASSQADLTQNLVLKTRNVEILATFMTKTPWREFFKD